MSAGTGRKQPEPAVAKKNLELKMIARSANFFSTHFVKELFFSTSSSKPHNIPATLGYISNWCGSRYASHATSGAHVTTVLTLTLALAALTLPHPPYKKELTGFTRFGKVTLNGSGGVRTPGPPRPATGLGRRPGKKA